ncbi:MAG: hypothetical protein L0Y80_05080 [Ignavibacteriae bacterium]|nr:hypothetical protein [Ignavibacteriota bacterium]
MAFQNPDPTFSHQADRVHGFYLFLADIRDKHITDDTDSRRVSLNNMMMAADAAMATLRLLSWAKEGGESTIINILKLSKPEYINLVAEDMLRASRLFLLLESQFQIETLFRNILLALNHPVQKQGFYAIANELLTMTEIADREIKLRLLNVPALMRNSMHSNGIHYGYKGSSTIEMIDNVEFRFEHGQRVQCGSWFHIITALRCSLNIVDELLETTRIKALRSIPDRYTVQFTSEGK